MYVQRYGRDDDRPDQNSNSDLPNLWSGVLPTALSGACFATGLTVTFLFLNDLSSLRSPQAFPRTGVKLSVPGTGRGTKCN